MKEIEVIGRMLFGDRKTVIIRQDDIHKIEGNEDMPNRMKKDDLYTLITKSEKFSRIQCDQLFVEVRPGVFKSGVIHPIVTSIANWFIFTVDRDGE